MKKTPGYLHFIILSLVTCSVCACGSTNNSETKAAADSPAQGDSSSNKSVSMVSTVIEGHDVQIDKNNPNTVIIDGQKVNVVSYSTSEGPAPDSMNKEMAYTTVVNGKKVTAYHKFVCPKPGDSQNVKGGAAH